MVYMFFYVTGNSITRRYKFASLDDAYKYLSKNKWFNFKLYGQLPDYFREEDFEKMV